MSVVTLIDQALTGLWCGETESVIMEQLRTAYLEASGHVWTPPASRTCDRGGTETDYVPSDDDDPGKLAASINSRLTHLRYYDGETPLDGPYLLTPFRPWYDDVIYSPCGSEAQGAHVNMLLQWQSQRGSVVSDLLPPYPGRSKGWRWSNVRLGSEWVVDVWLVDGAVAVQAS
ncbi:MAG: hypothetical protein OXQ93_13905 [Gemmatimonadota bacterium]|nr:hypothetical protein [Gemmatimonadota bacterium]